MVILALWVVTAAAEPTPGKTTVLGPFTGAEAPLHPANQSPRLDYYGTDLGWSYEHNGKLVFLFGDTNKAGSFEPVGKIHDDSFGTIDLSRWPDPAQITPQHLPRVKIGQVPGSSRVMALDPGYVSDSLKTPEGGFSNGKREFILFILTKPRGCMTDAQCGNSLTCDNGLGYRGPKFFQEAGLTQGCMDGSPGCNDDPLFDHGKPVSGSGLCSDMTSSYWADTPAGRVSGMAMKMRVGVRSLSDPAKYTKVRDWLTNKFINTALRTVQDFVPANGPGYEHQDYRPATGQGGHRRVLLWGRPGFVGVAADDRSLGLYFAYVDMPAGPHFKWKIHYFTGTGPNGVPQFSSREKKAAALDLDSQRPGVQPREMHDVVQHMSIVWIQRLKKWVMFYGGGMTRSTVSNPALPPDCGILYLFAGNACHDVVIGNGAIRMRTADNPWGPWSPPRDVLVGGAPGARPPGGQYASGGIMHHPRCTGPDCEPGSPFKAFGKDEYGWLYGTNIIEQWIRPAGDGVDVIWNASTWDPYRVVLLRTHINP